MSSAKTERLINLTMALLASRRYMKKAEIFRSVAGYSGSQETKERMFERDKDDLRSLGIEIDVGGHDPLFEDEPGYRIAPESYQLPPQGLTSQELGIIAIALDMWRGSPSETSSESIARRFGSLGIDSIKPRDIGLSLHNFNEAGLLEVTQGLAERRAIRFMYRKNESQTAEIREVHPLGMCAWKGSWYIVGEDLNKNEVRAFKLSRITSQIERFGPHDAFEIPEDFDVREYLIMFSQSELKALLHVRKNQVYSLRNQAESIDPFDDEWDAIKLPIDDVDSLLREILSFGDSVIVQEPEFLRKNIRHALQRVSEIYG